MIRKKILMAAIPLFVISGADAAVSLDRTRAVFDGSEKSMSKRKLTAVCSHQTRIGNLDAHLI